MKVRDLIKALSLMPQNLEVMLWDGWESEYNTKIKVKTVMAERHFIPKKKHEATGGKGYYSTEWQDRVRYMTPEFLQRRKIVELSATDNNGREESGR